MNVARVAAVSLLLGLNGMMVTVHDVSAVPSADLNSVNVYPNPFKPRLSHTAVTFDRMTVNARVRIYKITGELVRDLGVGDGNGMLVWNAANDSGEPVASGIYIYLITDGAGKKMLGKIAVLR